MTPFLTSIFKKSEPDILDSLEDLRDIQNVTDYCFYDAEANVVGMVSKYGNEKTLFSYIGKDVIRTCLLLDRFGKGIGSETRFCQIQCKNGVILLWNFDGSFLVVAVADPQQIPVVRMTVNVFMESTSKNKFFEKYFQPPSPSAKSLWENDHELSEYSNSIFGTNLKEEQ